MTAAVPSFTFMHTSSRRKRISVLGFKNPKCTLIGLVGVTPHALPKAMTIVKEKGHSKLGWAVEKWKPEVGMEWAKGTHYITTLA